MPTETLNVPVNIKYKKFQNILNEKIEKKIEFGKCQCDFTFVCKVETQMNRIT